MTEYTIDVNNKRYELNESFRQAIQERAEYEYEDNHRFSCWWSIANKENYTEEEWENNIHEEGDPILTIETHGVVVPWDDLDQLEVQAQLREAMENRNDDTDPDDEDTEEIDAGNGMKTIPPKDSPERNREIFGRTHFSITPPRYDELPSPGGEDPEKLPPEPTEVGSEPELVKWIPSHPDVTHTWETGRSIIEVSSWVEWNIQQRAEQPQPLKEKNDMNDRFESLCLIHDCEKVAEYEPSDELPDGKSGQVKRKGEDAYTDGRYGGGNWSV